MNNITTLLELAEARYELEELIENTVSNLTNRERILLLKESTKSKLLKTGLAATGLYGSYKYGKKRGYGEGNLDGKRRGRAEGLQVGVDKGAEMFDLGTQASDKFFRLRNIPKNLYKSFVKNEPPVLDTTPYKRAHGGFKDDPDYVYNIKMDREIPIKFRL